MPIKLNYNKSGKLLARKEQRRAEAIIRNEAYANLPIAEKKRRNPKKF